MCTPSLSQPLQTIFSSSLCFFHFMQGSAESVLLLGTKLVTCETLLSVEKEEVPRFPVVWDTFSMWNVSPLHKDAEILQNGRKLSSYFCLHRSFVYFWYIKEKFRRIRVFGINRKTGYKLVRLLEPICERRRNDCHLIGSIFFKSKVEDSEKLPDFHLTDILKQYREAKFSPFSQLVSPPGSFSLVVSSLDTYPSASQSVASRTNFHICWLQDLPIGWSTCRHTLLCSMLSIYQCHSLAHQIHHKHLLATRPSCNSPSSSTYSVQHPE